MFWTFRFLGAQDAYDYLHNSLGLVEVNRYFSLVTHSAPECEHLFPCVMCFHAFEGHVLWTRKAASIFLAGFLFRTGLQQRWELDLLQSSKVSLLVAHGFHFGVAIFFSENASAFRVFWRKKHPFWEHSYLQKASAVAHHYSYKRFQCYLVSMASILGLLFPNKGRHHPSILAHFLESTMAKVQRSLNGKWRI